MLAQLSISNFAIISSLDLALASGLNILSGETGAGKSIIINAINLILGGRASSDLIRSGCDEARVEALFSVPGNPALPALFADLGIPFDGELLIRRVIFREGRNKIHINGAMASLQMLQRLGAGLISISGQHEHQLLLNPDNHLYLLDDFAGLSQERETLADRFRAYQSEQDAIRRLEREIAEKEERRELNRFQIREIEQAAVQPGEDAELSAEKRRLRHAGDLLEIASEGYQALYESQDSVLGRISRCVRRLAKGADMDERLGPVRDALMDMEARLEDAGLSLREFRNSIDMDPQGLERIEERLEILGRLKRKYGDTLDDVLRARDRLSASEAGLEEGKERLERLTERQAEAARRIGRMAAALSGKRKKAATALEKAVEKELRQLHMEETRFRVQFEIDSIPNGKKPVPGIDGVRAEGMDRVEYMISANVGELLRPLSKIASGGELSRIMLAVKTILSRTASVETIIFDEVDSGISGATADVVGRKLLGLADYQQVVCITHLPQIASRGKTHFLVKKEVADGRTLTEIEALSPAERVREIARLLAGREITPRAVAHAKEMLRA